MKSTTKLSKRFYRLFLCAFMVFTLSSVLTNAATSNTLKDTYGTLFKRSGTCINLNQLQNPTTLQHVKSQYNSITLENEMKPDALLGYSPNLITLEAAKNLGYYIPNGYAESYVPKINFDTIDATLKICYENGIGVRAHTLIWHAQTPDWFFRVGYSTNYGYVSESVMNARMEYYIKTIMNHVYTGPYGSTVYSWDVVNEYLHATPSGWEAIYGKGGTTPAFVKRAFQYAYDCINYFGLTDSVSLFYNDFNTYMEVDNIITMINYINANGKICDGVGMQSHLSTSFPSVDYYTSALQAFVNAGFEVQITELDVVNNSDNDQATYLYQLMKNIIAIQQSSGNITGISYWGLSDDVTWIKGEKPLLFSTLGIAKPAYYQVLQAYSDAQGSSSSDVTGVTLKDGWYYIKNTNAQKYLQVANNIGGNGVNVEIGTGTGVLGQKWYLTNTNDGYITLKNGQNYMLDVTYGANENGTNIQTYSANNQDAQKFKLVTYSPTTYGILTKVSQDAKGLDVYNFQTADGSNVCQWTYYATNNQEWVFEPCNGPSNDSSNENKTMKEISDEYMANVKNTLVAKEPWDATSRKNNVQYGSIVKRQYYSSVTGRMTNLNVMLPANYDSSKKYPVLYLLHGYWGTEDSLLDAGDPWLKINEIISNLTADGSAKEMIVVFPYIYTSKDQVACSGLDLANSLAYDNFINALLTDIMPFINREYATLTDRSNTAIAGFSMGGREALYIGTTRPDLFGYVAGFCPAPGLTPGADLNFHPGQLQVSDFKIQDETYMPYLMMIVGGTNDTVVFNQPYTYHTILDNNKVNNVWLEVPGGGHDGSSIRPGIYNFARSIFKS